MAVTKTHPIKSTLKAAIDYILNPEKTDGKLLASSFGCGLETADIEFAWTREAAGDRGTHLGRHLIQSFAVGETTPEEAHKIGMELAGAVLGGKYEFVLTTHVDKDHLHNHLIFNSVSFVDYKKYHSNKQSYYHIRRTSDRICKEHGLSVVVPGQDRGKSYAEYTAEKQGTSYKAKLKTAIDNLIPRVKDFDELLRRLQEMGYEIKQGKYISFRAAGQERFTRTKTLGAAYTEEAIKERIKGVYVAKTKTLREDKKIRLVVDLENSIKAQQSAGYERWAKIHNLKQAAKSMNFLTENKIEYYSELESKIADIMTAHDAAAKAVLFCADCGSVMYQQRYQTDKRKQDCYICGNYKKRTHDCTAHFIRTDLLTAGVLSNLRKVTSYAAKHEARFMKLLIEQNEDGGKRRNAAKKKELEAAEKRIAELSAIFKRLYEDSVTGRISDERFTELSADYEAEQRELKERAAAIQAELSKAQEATVNAEKFMNVVRRHTSFEELTPTLLREFVEKIVVHECSYDENKTRRQDIEIYYSFVGKVDLPE